MTEQSSAAVPASAGPLYVTTAATIAARDLAPFYCNVAKWLDPGLANPEEGAQRYEPHRLTGGEDHITVAVSLPAERLPQFYVELANWMEPKGPRGHSRPH